MTTRHTWPLALSVGPDEMNAGSFEALAAAGIRELELSSGAIAPYYEELDFPHRSAKIAALARKCGINISSLHLPFWPFAEIDPASRDNAVRGHAFDIQAELLGAAAEAGIRLAVIHPSAEPYRDEERFERLNFAKDTIARIAETAEAAGVALCLENLPRTCLCRDSEEMLYFLRQIPSLRVVFDTNHSLVEDNAHFIRALGGRIATLHVSDYDFIDEKHWLPLEGKNDWEGIITALEETGYTGRFLYELKDGYTYQQVADNYRKLIGSLQARSSVALSD